MMLVEVNAIYNLTIMISFSLYDALFELHKMMFRVFLFEQTFHCGAIAMSVLLKAPDE